MFAGFCGQIGTCERLCGNCRQKWENTLTTDEKAAYAEAKFAVSASGKQAAPRSKEAALRTGGRTNKAVSVLGDSGSQAMTPGDQGT